MPPPPELPALTHIEKALADAYRKEIDQEENVWRALPFFAATLALQIAALFQVAERLPPLDTRSGGLAITLLAAAAMATLAALCVLGACIYPRKFFYLAPDQEILAYALGLMQDEADGLLSEGEAEATLKRSLAQQYALGSQNNRQINKRRERMRAVAGLITLGSVIATILLVAVTLFPYPGTHHEHAPPPARTDRADPGSAAPPPAAGGTAPAGGAADAGRDQGVVDPEGRARGP